MAKTKKKSNGGYWMRHRLKGTFKASLAESWNSAKSFAIIGGLYAAVSCFAKRIRQKEDGWNGAAAGCATGLALGWNGGPQSALQSCALFGIASYFLDGVQGGRAEAAVDAAGIASSFTATSSASLPSVSSSSFPSQAQRNTPSTSGPRTTGSAREVSRSAAGSSSAGGSSPPRCPSSCDEAGWLHCPQQQAGASSRQQPPPWLEAAAQQLAQQARSMQQHHRDAVRQLLSPAMPVLAVLAPCQFGDCGEAAACKLVRR
ncbi:hypothetical protein N2152v2_000414 [Parachlorella kessleri]